MNVNLLMQKTADGSMLHGGSTIHAFFRCGLRGRLGDAFFRKLQAYSDTYMVCWKTKSLVAESRSLATPCAASNFGPESTPLYSVIDAQGA